MQQRTEDERVHELLLYWRCGMTVRLFSYDGPTKFKHKNTYEYHSKNVNCLRLNSYMNNEKTCFVLFSFDSLFVVVNPYGVSVRFSLPFFFFACVMCKRFSRYSFYCARISSHTTIAVFCCCSHTSSQNHMLHANTILSIFHPIGSADQNRKCTIFFRRTNTPTGATTKKIIVNSQQQQQQQHPKGVRRTETNSTYRHIMHASFP